VLPFADLSEKQDQGYFADGMAEEIIDLLTKISQLTVIARAPSFQFKGREVDVKAIRSSRCNVPVLDPAYVYKDEDLYLVKGNPLFRNVANYPRYKAFLGKMDLTD
jgi:hypothetical protein